MDRINDVTLVNFPCRPHQVDLHPVHYAMNCNASKSHHVVVTWVPSTHFIPGTTHHLILLCSDKRIASPLLRPQLVFILPIAADQDLSLRSSFLRGSHGEHLQSTGDPLGPPIPSGPDPPPPLTRRAHLCSSDDVHHPATATSSARGGVSCSTRPHGASMPISSSGDATAHRRQRLDLEPRPSVHYHGLPVSYSLTEKMTADHKLWSSSSSRKLHRSIGLRRLVHQTSIEARNLVETRASSRPKQCLIQFTLRTETFATTSTNKCVSHFGLVRHCTVQIEGQVFYLPVFSG